MSCVAESQLCVKREVCKRVHLVCTRCGQAMLNVSEIGTLFVFALYQCSLLCSLLHEARWGDGGNKDLALKSSLEHFHTFGGK